MGDSMGEFIDFADITNQIYRCAMNRIYEFNLMIVGVTGIGKSTLVKSLFQNMMNPGEQGSGARLNEYSELLEENGVQLRLRCIETSNFDRHEPSVYVKYIEDQFESYFREQRRKSSWEIKDSLVHCCLYMIPPYGKLQLHKDDIACMKAIHEKVNLVPIIAKADSLNSLQLAKFKENILLALEMNKIDHFKFTIDEKMDEEQAKIVMVEAERFPFAIVTANESTTEGSKTRWFRNTIWGRHDILDRTKCDFDSLAKLLVRHCMLELMDSTHVKHYGKFKSGILDTARIQHGKNLEIMGLESFEVERVLYYLNSKKTKGSNDRKEALERELQELRNKVQSLKLSLKVA